MKRTALNNNLRDKLRREQTEPNIVKILLTTEKKRNGEQIVEVKVGENVARDTDAVVKQKNANSLKDINVTVCQNSEKQNPGC